MLKSIANAGIRTRLLGGFALICTLLAATVIYTVTAVSDISSRIKTVVDRRTPVAIASTEVVGNLYSTLSTLRGYLLTGDAQGKRDRAAVWAELDRTAAAIDRMAESFSGPQKINWSEARALIAEFRQAQD
jgi:methyl-accepting chemotaxis protein